MLGQGCCESLTYRVCRALASHTAPDGWSLSPSTTKHAWFIPKKVYYESYFYCSMLSNPTPTPIRRKHAKCQTNTPLQLVSQGHGRLVPLLPVTFDNIL